MSSRENYINAAINNEVAVVANAVSSTRNQTLNRAAFKLGTIPGMTTDTAINALLLGARSNGYVKEHGERATRQVIESGLKSGQRNLRLIEGVTPKSPRPVANNRSAAAPHTYAGTELKSADVPPASNALPKWSAPDENGKPKFYNYSEEGPPVGPDEIRRHVYKVDGQARRIKIKIRTKDDDSTWFNIYRVVRSDGVTGWQYSKPDGYRLIPYPPGINPFAAELRNEDLYWPEGEKDAETIVRLGGLAITFGGTGDGLPSGCESFFSGRNVIIPADNDESGRAHADRKATLIQPTAKSVRIIHFPELANKQDVSDWIELGHTIDDLKNLARSVEIRRSEAATLAEQPGDSEHAELHFVRRVEKLALPHGYSFSDRGLMWQNPDDLDKPAILVAGHFDVVAETRDGDGANWGVLLHWKDHDGREHQFALPRATLAGDGSEARRILMDGGFFIAPSQSARGLFNSFLLQVRSPNRARATQRVGWHSNSFVLPDACFANDKRDQLLLQSATAHEHPFRQAGTLESWQKNVARYAIGNSRLVLAISAAFAGPLVGQCAAEGGGVHFKGASSTGKSTALHVAGSVWGGDDGNGYVRSWRATANGLEGVALNHSDTLLCLDELSQLASKDAGESAYMLANGAGKSRSTRDGSARRAAKWRVLFLSSGEIGLADKVAEDGRGRRIAAGQDVRIVDVAADAGAGMGMFEELHGFASAEMLARHLRAATQQHYGVPARRYLAAIVPEIDGLRQQIAPIMKAFSEQYVPAGADGQVERVAQRFALIAVGGELAQRRGIVPWPPGEAVAAAGRCFNDWLAARGGHDAAEVRAGLDQVRSFLQANGIARFIPAWETDQATRIQPDVAGYRQKVAEGWDFFVTTTAWKEEVCRGLDARRLAATMAIKGYMDAPDPARRAKQVRVPGHGQLRLYHIVSRLLEDGE